MMCNLKVINVKNVMKYFYIISHTNLGDVSNKNNDNNRGNKFLFPSPSKLLD